MPPKSPTAAARFFLGLSLLASLMISGMTTKATMSGTGTTPAPISGSGKTPCGMPLREGCFFALQRMGQRPGGRGAAKLGVVEDARLLVPVAKLFILLPASRRRPVVKRPAQSVPVRPRIERGQVPDLIDGGRRRCRTGIPAKTARGAIGNIT